MPKCDIYNKSHIRKTDKQEQAGKTACMAGKQAWPSKPLTWAVLSKIMEGA